MRKTRFTKAQIVTILKKAEGGVRLADLSRQHRISLQRIYSWRAKCDAQRVFVSSGLI